MLKCQQQRMKTMAKKIDITEEDYAMLMPTGDRSLVKRDKV